MGVVRRKCSNKIRHKLSKAITIKKMVIIAKPLCQTLLQDESASSSRSTTDTASLQQAKIEKRCADKCRVKFQHEVRVTEIPHFRSFSAGEIRNIWYGRDDFASMKDEIKRTISLIEARIYVDDTDKYSSRGIESRIGENVMRRKRNKAYGLLAVLEEQDYQDTRGIWDPIAIASAYKLASRHCAEEAHKIALADELELPNYNICDDQSQQDESQSKKNQIISRLFRRKFKN
jgi:hypothetical protein